MGVEKLSETQYNNFGWVRQNDVLTPAEYSTLLSRFADYKHNKDKYPITRFGEAVIHSTQCPNVIMYVKGTIRNPQITKVVKINYFDIWEIKEELLSNEKRHLPQPYESIENFYGQEILSISKARDYASFRQYRAEQEGRGGAKSDSFGAEQFDRGGSLRESEEAYSGDDGVKQSPKIDREEKFYSELMRGLLSANGTEDAQLPTREAENADAGNESVISETSQKATDEDLIKSLMSGLGVEKGKGLYHNLRDSKFVGVGKKFTKAQKKKIIQQNIDRNGGEIRSDKSGIILVPAQKNRKSVAPNPLEVQIDHIKPISKGGSNSFSNAQVLSREENIKKSNK